jgi:hypothetical protein
MSLRITTTVVVDNDRNCIIGSGTTDGRPASPATGTLWFNTSLGVLEGWNGTSWITLTTA